MSILNKADFLSEHVIIALEEMENDGSGRDLKYYEIGDAFYTTLLRDYDINTDYIPIESEVGTMVRRCLVMHVMCEIATDKVDGSVLSDQLGAGNTLDPWAARADRWCKKKDSYLSALTSDDFYDPDNLPPEDEETYGNPMVTEWEMEIG